MRCSNEFKKARRDAGLRLRYTQKICCHEHTKS